MIASFIELVLSNPSVSLLVMGLIASGVSLYFKKGGRTKAVVVEVLVAYFFLFSIGIGYVYNFVMHVIFAEWTAKFIGWANSPFQLEVGFASLGMGVAGLIAFRQKLGFRVATFLPPAFFLLGAAGGHIYTDHQDAQHGFGERGFDFVDGYSDSGYRFRVAFCPGENLSREINAKQRDLAG